MIIFKGIQIPDFADPEETAALQSLEKAKVVKPVLNWIANRKNLYALKTTVLGKSVGVTENDMPDIYRIISDVCKILDYAPVPRLYVYHSSSFEVSIFAGTPALLVIPDFLLQEMDEPMLFFQFGRAITALKADTCQMKMLADALCAAAVSLRIPGVGEAAVALLADWSRKAGLTEDRGGLLACQDIYVAERALMRMTGMPLKYLNSECVIEYIKACREKPVLAGASQYLKTITRAEDWNNERIAKLYQWYYSGKYDDILEEYE